MRRWVQDGQFFADVEHAQEGGKALGEDEGVGRAGHAPVEFQNEEQGQKDVHDGGDDEEDDGRLAVSQGAQQGRKQVVGHHGPQAFGDDDRVGAAVRVKLRRHVHPVERRVDAKPHDDIEHNDGKEAEHGAHGDAVPHPLRVPRPVKLPDEHREAVRQAHGHHDEEHEQRRRGTDRRQRVHADRASDNDDVGDAVHLLENITDNQGNHEANQELHRISRSHVPFHLTNPDSACDFYSIRCPGPPGRQCRPRRPGAGRRGRLRGRRCRGCGTAGRAAPGKPRPPGRRDAVC